MARLTAKARRRIPGKDFAGKGRSYPIENESHAEAALRDAHFHPEEAGRIRAAVRRKYPGMGGREGTKSEEGWLDRQKYGKR